MLKFSTTTQFERDLKKAAKQHKNLKKLWDLIELLIKNKPLKKKHRNHKLKGNFVNHWECHVEPDWLLVYMKTDDEIRVERLGSHAELYK